MLPFSQISWADRQWIICMGWCFLVTIINMTTSFHPKRSYFHNNSWLLMTYVFSCHFLLMGQSRKSYVIWFEVSFFNFNFLIYFIDYVIIVAPFPPLYSLPHCTPLPPALFPLSSCPWVVHVSSLGSPFPVLYLTSPCLFCTYKLCFLFPVPFPPSSPLPLPSDNPPCDLHLSDSVPVLAVFLVCLCYYFLGSVVDSYEFVVILLFIVFDLLLFLR